MIGKLLILAVIAATHAKRFGVDDQTMIASERCPAEGHHLLPHEWDCKKFYYCEYGQKWETPRDCSPGTEFSYALQVCVHPNSANCDLPGVPPESEEVTEAPEPETEAPSTRPPRPTTEAPAPETEAPEPETEAPEPEPETERPTRPPRPTTEAPAPETEAPEPETEAPEPETEAPEPETEAPEPETEAPEPETEAPEPETEAPEPETEAPEPETEAPEPEPETERPTRPPRPTTEAPTEATRPPRPTTEAPEQEWLPNGCPADLHEHWLLPHETRCDKFYYCVYGEKVVRQCAPGTHFNPEIQVCDWPENVNCANADSSELDPEGSGDPDIDDDDEEVLPNGCPADFDQHKLLPHENDCSKFYYCVFGETVERQCGEGTLFNPEIQVCDWPHNVDCANSGNSNEDHESRSSSEEGEDHGSAGESEEDDILENGCPADFDVHKLLPHENDCTRFYYCVHGNKVERECGAGTHFNPVEQVCDWPENAGCAFGGETTEPDTDASTEATTRPTRPPRPTRPTTEAPEPETEAPEIDWLPNGCPADFDIHQLLPHENDCSKFYYCVHGEKVQRECRDGLYFNPDVQACDWPVNVDCSNANSGESSEPQPSSEESDSIEEGSGNDNDNGVLDNGCPADFDVHQLLPHESDCARFYYCVRGEKVERECGPGTHFNPVEQVCDWPQNAGCANAGSNESVEDNSSSEENDSGDNGSGDNGNGVLENGCPADFNQHQLLPHENDCTKFYYCVHGEKVERDCGPNTHFNPVEQVCDWPENAGCAIGGETTEPDTDASTEATTRPTRPTRPPRPTRPTTEAPEPETEAPEPETEAPEPETEAPEPETEAPEATTRPTRPPRPTRPTTEAPEPETEAPEVELLPNGCPADFDIHQLLPHESNCGKFYYCVHGEKVERECSGGLHFNPAIQVCDWPANVDCSNANSGESNEPQPSSEESDSIEDGSGDDNDNNGVLDNGCPADFDVHQLLPHESDCARFYYCVRGEKVERECGPGTHFNPVEQVCDWPQNAGCANAGSNESVEDKSSSEENDSGDNGSGDNGNGVLENGCPADFNQHQLLPHENDCTKFYYCVHGEKVERDCGPNTHFNPVEQVCDWPENAGCAIGGETTEPDTDASTEATTRPTRPTRPPRPTSPTTEAPEPETEAPEPETEAPEPETEAPEPETEAPEPETEAPEPETEAPEATTRPTRPPRPTRPTTEAPEPETEAPEVELLPNGCPADFDIHQLLPHESNCGKFYYCVHGEKVERECSGGLHFNPAIQVCDWPANVDCSNANSGESNGESGENNTSEEGNNSETGDSGENGPDVLPNGCPADFDVHKLLPHPYYCDKFFYCVNGAKVERECGRGTHFNYELQVCDWPENVNCVDGSGVGEPTESSEESKSVEETDPILPNGCPADFNIHQLLPHESECGKFYQCAHGQKVERQCAPGTHFNAALQVCDWPHNAGCENAGSDENESGADGNSGEDETSAENGNSGESSAENGNSGEDSAENGNSGENSAEDGNSGENSAENGNSAENSAENGNSGENSAEDGNGGDIIIPSEKCETSCNIPAWAHEHDCDKFWRCDGGNAVLGTCSEGLHFNVNTQTCDFICNAGCVRDDVQSTPEHDGLKLFLPWDKVDGRIRRLYLTGRE